MKLTNISLAILVALGLVACGGSDDNNNQVPDNTNAGHQGSGNGNPPPPPPTPKKEVEDPDNRASALEVEKRLESNTATAKAIYANTSALDTLGGYRNGYTYNSGAVDTASADLKRANSIVNYLQAGWVNDSNAGNNANAIRLNPLQTYALGNDGNYYRVVAIRNGNNPALFKNWDQALPTDFFAVGGPGSGVNAGNNVLYDYAPSNAFTNYQRIPASRLYYIPNVMTANVSAPPGAPANTAGVIGNGTPATPGIRLQDAFRPSSVPAGTNLANNYVTFGNAPFVPSYAEANSANPTNVNNPAILTSLLGNMVLGTTENPGVNGLTPATDGTLTLNRTNNSFDLSRDQVTYSSIKVGDKVYPVGGKAGTSNSISLDLALSPKEEIQKVPVELNYTIADTKATISGSDNDTLTKTAKAGELRVYNLNYSLALLEVNEAAAQNSAAPNAEARNGLGFGGLDVPNYVSGYGNWTGQGSNGGYGAFQVKGFQTTSLPLNGRATYTGKSYGVNSTGDINLTADFGEDRAGIHGSVKNRVDSANNSLDDMNLQLITLSQPGQYSVTGSMGIDSNSSAQNGVVDLGGQTNWGTWAVQLYGPNAENAAGVIAQGGGQATAGSSANNTPLNNVVEVFNSARTDINPKSLNNQKNP